MPQEDFADVQIRILRLEEQGYPLEIVLNGEQHFPPEGCAYMAAEIAEWQSGGDPVIDGQALFASLFADPLLQKSWHAIQGQAPQRRIRLWIDRGASELQRLPWELLWEDGGLLSANAGTPFSRYLPVALPWGGAVTERPIRVLVAIANPKDIAEYQLPPLDIGQEQRIMQTTFAQLDAQQIQLTFLEPPVTLPRLEAALREGVHILHYIGHGAFNARAQQTALYLQDDDGYTDIVTDDAFTTMLTRQRIRPRLVFLATCQSATWPATVDRDSSLQAFSGLGPKLVAAGVPAVVAMQDYLTIPAAQALGRVFYERLSTGPVDQALNEARGSLLTQGIPDVQVPVLYMRLRSGEIWGNEGDARGTLLSSGANTAASEAFWDALLTRIDSGACVPIVGPRVHGQWLPGPDEVAQRWAEKNGYPFSNADNLAHVAQFLDATGGEDHSRDSFLRALKSEFLQRLPQALRPSGRHATLTDVVQAVGWEKLVTGDPNEVHRVLASLNLPLYLTTNCDSFMTEALRASQIEGHPKSPQRQVCAWRPLLDESATPAAADVFQPFSPEAPLVYHLFGSDQDLRSLVISEDHYLDFLSYVLTQRERISNAIRAHVRGSVLLFIGYNLHDWQFRAVMRGLVATLRFQFAFKHVAVQLESVERTNERAARQFLEKYFEHANVNVYWGTPAQFAAELRERWEGDV